jgi:hypothetical protein
MSIPHKIAIGFIIGCFLAAVVGAVDVMLKVHSMVTYTDLQAEAREFCAQEKPVRERMFCEIGYVALECKKHPKITECEFFTNPCSGNPDGVCPLKK